MSCLWLVVLAYAFRYKLYLNVAVASLLSIVLVLGFRYYEIFLINKSIFLKQKFSYENGGVTVLMLVNL